MISPQKQYEVSILFRVHAPKASPLERVWLLGSIPELGEWNPARAVECGQAADEWKVWQATVRLPTDSSFKWAWCTLTVDGHLKSFENGDKRFRQIFCYSGVLHTIYSEPDVEVFRQNMGSAVLTTERKTKRNDVVAVIGSCPSLGCWDPKHAVIANEFPRRSGNWTATVFFDSGRLQEWNWIIMDKNTKEIRLSEKHSTRFLFDTHGWIKIHVEWNKEPAVLDWAPRDHVGDDYIGTVELLRKMKARLLEIRRWEDAAEARRLGFPAGRMLPSPTLMGQINLPQYSNITFLSSPTMSPSKSPQPVLQIKPFRGSGLPDQINTSPIKSPPASPIRSVSPGTGDQAPPDASMPALQPHTSRTRAVSPPPVPKRSAGTCTEVVSESNSESERIKKQKNTPIDMSLLGFHCAPPQQSPPRGKTESGTDEKRRNLVSDPGKPGYSSDLPHGFGTDPDGQARKYNVTSTSPPLFSRYDSSPPPFSRYDISSPPFSRYDSSPPLFSRYDSSPPLDVGANDSKIAPTPGIENYLGHSLLGRDAGILISSGKPLLLGGGTVSGMEEKLGLPPNMEVGMDRLKCCRTSRRCESRRVPWTGWSWSASARNATRPSSSTASISQTPPPSNVQHRHLATGRVLTLQRKVQP
ncbi:uncharacterized protein LOC112559898 isoform X2 [Pomacea canaliculata]|uniref:uncharacterized protein LOC112559898 isoform X2 n=1 Tax=Pomacea canaliculata TaxID=400727 RepID=UPI000D725B09|nr:uncharacterized protein LOC112559898 isoform X2 [Pomacea canaliculata]